MGRWQGTEDTLALPLRASLVGELVRAGQASCGSMVITGMKMALIASLVIEALTAVELGSLLYWARLHHESDAGPGSWRQLLASSPARREPFLNGSPPRPGAAWTGRVAFLTRATRLIRGDLSCLQAYQTY